MIRDDRASEGTVLLLGAPPALRDLLLGLLEEEGYAVRSVAGMEEAVEVLSSERIDLVALDAGDDPEAVVRDLRAAGGSSPPPVIVFTDQLSHDLMALLSVAGAADFILKPVEAEEFAARVRGILRGPRAGDGSAPLSSPAATADLVDIASGALEMLSSLPGWLLVVDKGLRVRFANRAFLQRRDCLLPELAGASLEEVLTADLADADGVLSIIRNAVGSGRAASLPAMRLSGESGPETAVDMTVRPVRLRGEPYALLIIHDVSEHLRAREQIREEKRKLEEIVDGMGASLGVLDRDLRVVWSNRKFRDWFGELWGRRFDHALRGLVLMGNTDPEQIFTEPEYISKEWAHYGASGDKRFYRNIILPSHDEKGQLDELVLVTQDLTEVTLRSEQHRLLRDLGNLLQSTLELDRLLYIILTCATAGHALGFNRAFIFLVDEETREVCGSMGVGPSSQEEAFTIWAEIAGSRKTLTDLTSDFEQISTVGTHSLTRLVREIRYPLTGDGAAAEVVSRTVLENQTQVVEEVDADERVTDAFRSRFGSREFVSVPLQSKGRVVGVLLADNVFSNRPISADQVAVLELFASPAGLAVDNARTYAALKRSLDAERDAQHALLQSERLATVGRLAAHVAHEIRNPLTTIGGFARAILKRPRDMERVESSAAIITEEVARLEQILSGVMDFTRPATLRPVMDSANEVVSRVAVNLELELAEAGVELRLEPDPALPQCPLDPEQLHQALLNLLRNGAEILTSPEWAAGERRLTIRTRATETDVLIEVADTGPGVPDDLLPMMFEPFISRRVGGTGLGLAVVRKILLDHGGEAAVRNRSDGGAVFTLSLPRGRPEEADGP